MIVTLTSSELIHAAIIGAMRNVSSIKKRLENSHGLSHCESDWQIHIEGACGECALAKHLNIYWNGSVNTFKAGGDVGSYQVRTRSRHEYELILRHDDSSDSIYWLVTGTAPNYSIRGWIRGRDGKRQEWIKSHGGREPAFFVPHHAMITDRKPEPAL